MTQSGNGIGIIGLGVSIPEARIDNETIADQLDVSSEWVAKVSGIETRSCVAPGESASQIAVQACRNALQSASDLKLPIFWVIGGTSTGDYAFPALAARVQGLLKLPEATAFDISASGAAFPLGLKLAESLIRSSCQESSALLFGAAVQSPFISKQDAKIGTLLGDAAGAALIGEVPEGYGLIGCLSRSNGEQFEAARMRGGGSSFPNKVGMHEEQFIEMDGEVMTREFIKTQALLVKELLAEKGMSLQDVDLFIFHQASPRIIRTLMSRLKLPMEKTLMNVETLGNTAEASIPTVLYQAQASGRLKRGDVVLLSGLGAGTIIAASLMLWY